MENKINRFQRTLLLLFSALTVTLIFEIKRSKLINSNIFWDHILGVRSIFFFLSIEITEGQANTTTRIICSIENPPQRLKKNTAYSCPP